MNAQQYLTPTLSNANTLSFYPLHLPAFLVSFPRIKTRKARQFVWWFLHDAPACATFETGRGVTSVLHIRSTLTVPHTVQLTIIIFLFPFQYLTFHCSVFAFAWTNNERPTFKAKVRLQQSSHVWFIQLPWRPSHVYWSTTSCRRTTLWIFCACNVS